ncbi:hypothetical protein [Anabaena sp. UHCC 0399]|uniref:hypothetical protein n=1 Tax=Anabaena sp. UHCC 0399 TaxID=3110238 RepID=UPI002B21DD82|nr:hypothetical protein [Anabaena sp. UHCC 0399]MEA5564187.1 hypothetical protein [Anabaena sp. UHCC 0399]
MKLQKTTTTSKLEQASMLLNKIDDSSLQEVTGGFGYTNPDPNRPESEKQGTRAV